MISPARLLAFFTLISPLAVTGANLYYYAEFGAANPFEVLRPLSAVLDRPSLLDVDGDGDRDLVVLEGDRFRLATNTGTAAAPVFAGLTPGFFQSLQLTAGSHPAFGKVDGDNDFDLVVGTAAGTFRYFSNTGTAAAMTLTERTGAANPFNGIDIGSNASPAVVDIDGDGDRDVVAGDHINDELILLRNTGTAAAPVFAQQTYAPFTALTLDSPVPVFVDLDGDADQDLVIRGYYFFTNTGTAAAPVYVEDTVTFSPRSGWYPAIADMNQDGNPDMLLFNDFAYLSRGSAPPPPPFTADAGLSDSLTAKGVEIIAAGDLDGDGDMDLLSASRQDSTPNFYRNDGTATAPAWTAWPSAPAIPAASPYISSVAMADVDGDGDQDVLHRANPLWQFYRNTGSPSAPAFTLQSGAADPFNLSQEHHTVTFGDLDGDGDLDFATGHGVEIWGGDGTMAVRYFENTGSATAPAWVQRTGAANPFNITSSMDSAAPCLSDMDRDGDLDLIIGGWQQLFYLPNTGSRFAPAFTRVAGSDSPLALLPIERSYRMIFPLAGEWRAGGARDLIISAWRNKNYPIVTFFTGNNPVTKFSTWQSANFTLPAQAALAAADADPDKDGVVNLIEYAVKSPPKTAGGKPGTVIRNAAGVLQLVLDVRDDDPDLSAVGQSGASASVLSGSIPPVITDPVPGDGLKRWTFTDQPPAGINLRRFLRARFSLN